MKVLILALQFTVRHYLHRYWSGLPRCNMVTGHQKKTLQDAQTRGCFLVPDGHHGSKKENIQWRITLNLIKRLLMFSLHVVQLEGLVVLKIIKTRIRQIYFL